jgi:hypothetical protein
MLPYRSSSAKLQIQGTEGTEKRERVEWKMEQSVFFSVSSVPPWFTKKPLVFKRRM